MAIVDDLMQDDGDLLTLDGQSLEEMQEDADHTSDGAIEPVIITIEWLEARIVELEVLNAVLRDFRALREDS